MKVSPLFACLLFVCACAHEPQRLPLGHEQRSKIEAVLAQVCPRWCVLEECWKEQSDVGVCNVGFSFAVEDSKRKAIEQIIKLAEKQQMKVALCGDDTFSTKMVAAFIGGASGAAVARVTHSTGDPAALGAVGSNISTKFCK